VSRADASPVRPERGRSACASRDRYSISRLQKHIETSMRSKTVTVLDRSLRFAVGILPLLSLTRRGARKRIMTTSIYQLWHGATPPLYVRRAFCVNEMVFAAMHGYAYHRTSTRAATRPTSGNRSAAWERVPLLLDALARHRRSGTAAWNIVWMDADLQVVDVANTLPRLLSRCDSRAEIVALSDVRPAAVDRCKIEPNPSATDELPCHVTPALRVPTMNTRTHRADSCPQNTHLPPRACACMHRVIM
jgi:hypothetical protein